MRRLNCPRCKGTVEIPERPTSNVTCPFCKQFLVSVDARTGAICTPRWIAPDWMRTAGLWMLAAAAVVWCYVFISTDENHLYAHVPGVAPGIQSDFYFANRSPVVHALWIPGAALYLTWVARRAQTGTD